MGLHAVKETMTMAKNSKDPRQLSLPFGMSLPFHKLVKAPKPEPKLTLWEARAEVIRCYHQWIQDSSFKGGYKRVTKAA
jgi:hypothetical protein